MSTQVYGHRVNILLGGFAAITMSCDVSAADIDEYTAAMGLGLSPNLRVARFVSASTVEFLEGRRTYVLTRGERHGAWTFMGIASGSHRYAVFEDFHTQDGDILLVDTDGVQGDLSKTSESNVQNPDNLYLGHSREEVFASSSDLLGREVLSHSGDPEYPHVSNILPKIEAIPRTEDFDVSVEGFVGTPDTDEAFY